MKRLAFAIALGSLLVTPAVAQQHIPQQTVGGEYTAAPFTLSNGQRVMFQFDVNGDLKVVSSGSPSGTQDVNVKNWAGVALGAPSAYGVSPGSVNVPGVNAFITNTPSVSFAPFTPTGSTGNSPFAVTSASSRNALPGAGATALITNLTSQTVFVAFGDNTVVATTANTPVQGGQTIPLAVGAGTFIAAITATGASQIQVISGSGAPTITYGTVAVNDAIGVDTSGTLTAASQTVVAAMDGNDSANVQLSGTYGAFTVNFMESPDGGTHNNLVQCAVTDSTGTRVVSSYDLAANQSVLFHCNNLNGSDTFTVTSVGGPGSGTANVDISISGLPSVLGATIGTVLIDYNPASQSITAADAASTSTPGQDSVNQITGAATAGSTVAWKISGQALVNVQLSGTWVGTQSFEKSLDGGTTWVSFGCQTTGAVYRHNTVTGNGQFLCEVGGTTNFRVRQTIRSSGTVVVTPTFSSASTIAKVANANSIFDNVSGAQASIKPASTPPVATDTSHVVALNPNAPVLNTTPTIANGNGVVPAPTTEALGAVSHSPSVTTAESCRVLKNSPGNLYSVRVSIAATTGYVMVFDATSAPGDGAVTTLAIPAVRVVSDGTSGWYADDFNPPMRLGTGITVCFSSTGPFSKTASATAAIEGQVQ